MLSPAGPVARAPRAALPGSCAAGCEGLEDLADPRRAPLQSDYEALFAERKALQAAPSSCVPCPPCTLGSLWLISSAARESMHIPVPSLP